MKTLEIPREGRTPSQIRIGAGAFAQLSTLVPAGRPLFVVTDSNLARIYAEQLAPYRKIIIGLGEENKTLATVEQIHTELIAAGADRGCYLVGFGGGIVTDITGFVASTYMRGVGFGFVATSLLAQVDASVGGKNGVNLGGYKNMVGVFNQPDFVLCDVALLETLPRREFVAGLAEVVKSAVIDDARLFEMLERTTVDELLADVCLLSEVVARTVSVKARIVEADEREGGVRRLLNLGHTVGHAIEKCSRRWVHGEAVAIGMNYIGRAAERAGVAEAGTVERIVALLSRLELPTECETPMSELTTALRKDKKGSADKIHVVLPCAVGRCEVQTISYTALDELLLG